MAEFGIKAVMGLSNAYLEEANARAYNIVSEANAWASNLVRGANNELKAKRGSLARYNQSVNNQRVLDNAGDARTAALVNYRRARDSAVQEDFETQLKLSEQAGAQAAASALSGLSGGVADIVAGTSALRASRIKQRAAESMAQGDWDAQQMTKNITAAGYDQLDQSEITEDLDHSIDVAQRKTANTSIWAAVMSQQDMKSMANIASEYGGKAKAAFSFSKPKQEWYE